PGRRGLRQRHMFRVPAPRLAVRPPDRPLPQRAKPGARHDSRHRRRRRALRRDSRPCAYGSRRARRTIGESGTHHSAARARLPRRLAALGFRDVHRVRFGEPTRIRKNWSVTTFEPASYWNDAFVLIDVDGFRIFDINDAGVNARIAKMAGPVDVLAVQFSAG